uniref:Uncharacterized protein n=1 Tax=Arion vulgaris TaxID=1028688 RepID=A0A0B6Y7P7_9EUPU
MVRPSRETLDMKHKWNIQTKHIPTLRQTIATEESVYCFTNTFSTQRKPST